MRNIVIGGLFLGALVLGGCDDKPSGGNAAPSASVTAATAPPATSASAAAAPSASAKAEEKKKAEGPKDHKSRLKAMTEAWGAHDAKKIAALYSEHAVLKMAGRPELKGREAIEKDLGEHFAGFKDASILPGRVWEKDKHTALVEWVMKGTNTGELPKMGIPKATNKPFGVAGATWIEIDDDGFIKEEHSFMDTPNMLAQVKEEKKIRGVLAGPTDGTDAFESADAKLKEAKDEKAKGELAKAVEAEKKNLEAEEKFAGHINGNKEAEALKLVADDFKLVDYTQEKDLDKKGFKELVHMWLASFGDLKVKNAASFAAGDFVVQEVEYTGVQKAPFMGIKDSHKPINLHMVQVDQFKDGKIVKSWSWGNSAELFEQIAEKKEEKKK
jgi:steroid delta-isomerase-like uncharacterized protein